MNVTESLNLVFKLQNSFSKHFFRHEKKSTKKDEAKTLYNK